MTRSERAREREAHKYYQTWLASSRGFLSPKNISRDDPLLHETGVPRHESTQRISRDKALVAFAQLGCLRLNVKRGIITLLSSSTAYVLAEATRTISLLSGGQHADGDGLWFGTASIPRSQSVSENALDPPLYTAKSSDGQSYSAPALVIGDMSLDKRSLDKKYVGNGTSFYAGVPISTKNGFTIGVYTVTDDKVREGLTIEELQFMQDMASTVMDHLENIRNDTARHRGERMVLGLGAFTEGQATMDADTDDDNSISARETSSQATRNSFHRPTFKGMTITETDPIALRNKMMREGLSSSTEEEDPGESKPSPVDGLQQDRDDLPHALRLASDSTAASTTAPKSRKSNTITTDAPLGESLAALTTADQSSIPRELRQTFARAANILRQCTASDGVMFFDAQSANVGNDYRAAPAFFHSDSNDASTSSEDTMSSSGGLSDDLGDHETGNFNRPSPEYEVRPKGYRKHSKAKICEMLGYSFRLSSVAELKNSSSEMVLREGEMRRFIRRYPKGLVMHFTKDGEVSSSDESSAKERTMDVPTSLPEMTLPQKEKKRVIAKELIKVMPGARNVIFLPLWDFSRARWSAGCFIWSSRPERLLNAQEDLVYMKVFANTVMREINRLEAIASDQVKTSFVANISHELRSPLHGILGSIEFLQDTAVDPFQASMITTVETCGKTLLETVNHVLDFAKLSKRSRKELLRIKDTATPAHSDLEMDVDLAVVVEEVVEAIYAGQTFHSTGAFHGNEDKGAMYPSPEDGSSDISSLKRTQSKFVGAVRLLLDIERLDSWRVRTQPGALRRVVMNLLGNALKYTEKGLVCVSLQPIQGSSRKRSDLGFCITVADTGKGMSIDFARNHAWEAFSQEDSFASGVGLGLSIVRHITSSLGGKIDLKSSKDKGTDIRVLLTAPFASVAADNSQQVLETVAGRVNGLKLCILDPGYERAYGTSAELNMRAEDTVRRMASSWFGMEVFKAPTVQGVKADFFIYIEPPSTERLLKHHEDGVNSTDVPLIIITPNAVESAALRKDTQKLKDIGRTIDVISQPCGPQKLARVFERCICREPFTAPSDIANTSLAALRIGEGVGATATRSQHQNIPGSDDLVAPNALARKQESLHSESTTSNPSNSDTPIEPSSESLGGSALSALSINHRASSAPSASNDDTTSSLDESSDKVAYPVLLVDDNEVNLKLLVAFVRKARYHYEVARDGLEALQLYKAASKDPKRAFRAVVIDVQMPVMDGITATREIRFYEAKERIDPAATVVALTGLASNATQQDCAKAGVDHFLPKPVRFKEFLKLLPR